MVKRETLIKKYLDYYDKLSEKYSNLVIILENGKFYEIKGVENDKENIGYVSKICEQLNLTMMGGNGTRDNNSRIKPLCCGFQTMSKDKYIPKLIESGYTVAVIDQITSGANPKRKIVDIISPSTYLSETNSLKSNNLVSVYIEEELNFISAGAAMIDISTGKNVVYEIHNKRSVDNSLSYEEIYRFISTHSFKEIVIHTKSVTISEEELVRYFDLKGKSYKIRYNDPVKEYSKLMYQIQLLESVFTECGLLNPIQFIELERYPISIVAYIILLQFVYELDPNLIKGVEKPDIWEPEKNLILDYNAIYQLNVVSSNNLELGANVGKFSSLMEVVDSTSTAMGKRLLESQLLLPIRDKDELSKRYDMIGEMRKEGSFLIKVENELNKIPDIDRIFRRMILNKINPNQFYMLYCSTKVIKELIELIKGSDKKAIKEGVFVDNWGEYSNELDEFIKKVEDTFEITKMKRGCEGSFFKEGVNENIDKLIKKIDKVYSSFYEIAKELSDKIEKGSNLIKVESTEKEGYYLALTKKRCEVLKKKMGKEVEKYQFRNQTNSVKVFSGTIKSNSEKYSNLKETLVKTIEIQFREMVKECLEKYTKLFRVLIEFIGKVDVIKSNGKVSMKYNYNRPEFYLEEKETVRMEGKSIRHPIIERILMREGYVPNDIYLDSEDNCGILLFGVNAAGKSSLMKSVGLILIMAQAGMYVPCLSFKFTPFKRLITRITAGDNMFKGQSSFAVEMSELNKIVRRADSETLVIGDEICKGTEIVSGTAIMGATIKTLSKRGTPFVFTTHMHGITELGSINELGNVNYYHFKVSRSKDGVLIYDRVLKEGSGDWIYGIEVGKAMGLPDIFIKECNDVVKELIGIDLELHPTRRSRYNSNMFISKCKICGEKAEHTHHISFQCSMDSNGFTKDNVEARGHISKNSYANLVALCEKCHIDVHRNKMEVKGYKQTSRGIELELV